MQQGAAVVLRLRTVTHVACRVGLCTSRTATGALVIPPHRLSPTLLSAWASVASTSNRVAEAVVAIDRDGPGDAQKRPRGQVVARGRYPVLSAGDDRLSSSSPGSRRAQCQQEAAAQWQHEGNEGLVVAHHGADLA
jgi:hypothetical protein